MKIRYRFTALLFLGLGITLATTAQSQASSVPDLPHSTRGHGPSLLLLHDASSGDQDWTKAAALLANRFEVTLVDVTELLSDSEAVQRLRKFISKLNLDDSHIAGSLAGESLALRYALTFPNQSRSFTLPLNGEDLRVLAAFINSTPFCKS